MTSQEPISIKPLGYVQTQAVGDQIKDKTHLSKIVLAPELAPALDGLSEYSHLFVLFWLHEISDEKRLTLKVHPRGRADMPLVGIFATRTNHRPNPIGLTLVELLKIDGTVLTVRGLDAYNGTPVLDIKPYDQWDQNLDARVPQWRKKLDEEKKQP
jgi:tRNA-Thr(GGU) m(6)t(6)A37 methyltransferase TsaA